MLDERVDGIERVLITITFLTNVSKFADVKTRTKISQAMYFMIPIDTIDIFGWWGLVSLGLGLWLRE
jgi:hypothetical protein